MKSLATLALICLSFFNANAQEVNYQSIKGSWEYKSPKGKNKLTYKFDVDNKFIRITEHKENELQEEGTYELDKKEELDRLKLSQIDKENSTNTIILYHFIKLIGTDTIKTQRVNGKQTNWIKETRKNTMIFIRKTEKTKE